MTEFAEELLTALVQLPPMPADPATLLPDVPNDVLPVQTILALLEDWMEEVERWAHLIQDVDGYVNRLIRLDATAVPHRVVGL